jgi:cytochrome c556
MKTPIAIVAVTLGVALVAGRTVAAGPDEVDVRTNMVEGVNPAALAIWDVGNAATDENGGLDPAQMDAAAWAKVAEAAQSLGTYAHRLGAAKVIQASGPDLVDGKVPEGVASREQIQAMIDANPGGFRAAAATMEQRAKALATAATERNLEQASELIATLDQPCQACHENYWYPKP